jgi:hypothetical protein
MYEELFEEDQVLVFPPTCMTETLIFLGTTTHLGIGTRSTGTQLCELCVTKIVHHENKVFLKNRYLHVLVDTCSFTVLSTAHSHVE